MYAIGCFLELLTDHLKGIDTFLKVNLKTEVKPTIPVFKNKQSKEVPGGPEVKTPCIHCRDAIPAQGLRSCMLHGVARKTKQIN